MANNASSSAVRKAKNNKKSDSVDTSKLVEQALSRLERDVQGDREQELEIGTSDPQEAHIQETNVRRAWWMRVFDDK